MPEPIEAEYFNWLCAKVVPLRSNQYQELLRILYTTEYVWTIAGDRNRCDDGCELRRYFLDQVRTRASQSWLDEPCSVLEMLIAFADRASFQTDRPMQEWFWKFIENLRLEDYRHLSRSDIPVIEEVLHVFIWRLYERNGQGGMFPLHRAKRDQRRVEIWYQFCDYLQDRGLM